VEFTASCLLWWVSNPHCSDTLTTRPRHPSGDIKCPPPQFGYLIMVLNSFQQSNLFAKFNKIFFLRVHRFVIFRNICVIQSHINKDHNISQFSPSFEIHPPFVAIQLLNPREGALTAVYPKNTSWRVVRGLSSNSLDSGCHLNLADCRIYPRKREQLVYLQNSLTSNFRAECS
jgi:hypothetical protein